MKDGGQAYPTKEYDGMTMRQRYKIAAMQLGGFDNMDVCEIAEWCGLLADAMISEDELHTKGEA